MIEGFFWWVGGATIREGTLIRRNIVFVNYT